LYCKNIRTEKTDKRGQQKKETDEKVHDIRKLG
jgi:hypothetical protein